MNVETIREQVIEVLEDICNEKILDTSPQLRSELHMDSMQMVMILVLLEETFEIELDESDMNPFALITVQNVVDLVTKYKSDDEVKIDG